MNIEKPLVSIVLGTRPEAIKLAPLILKFKESKDVRTRVILTGQHREMVLQVLELFEIEFDLDIDLMMEVQSLTYITTSTLEGLRKDFEKHKPDLVIVQGDTSTAFSSALAAFYQKIPIGHVEAGLRTYDVNNPFPEEANRRLISQIALMHFAPTSLAKDNLIKSGISKNIFITGNTVIDALYLIDKKFPNTYLNNLDIKNKRLILASVHRRENWGGNLLDIGRGLIQILNAYEETVLLLPLHKNPIVREPLKKILECHKRAILVEPLAYDQLVWAMKKCEIILTDSGGLQEEAPAFGKPVLILRKTTERSEAVHAGTAKIVGTNSDNIYTEASKLLSSKDEYKKMSNKINPFGDGHASERIFNASMEIMKI